MPLSDFDLHPDEELWPDDQDGLPFDDPAQARAAALTLATAVAREDARLRAGGATGSPPPCGEEVEVGVCAKAYEGLAPTPPPSPSPQGEGKGVCHPGAAQRSPGSIAADGRE
jgi:hypothetical protein